MKYLCCFLSLEGDQCTEQLHLLRLNLAFSFNDSLEENRDPEIVLDTPFPVMLVKDQ